MAVVLVTGGAGYIGSFAVRLLVENKFDVIVIDNLSTGFADAVHKSAQFINGNILDKELVKKVFSNNKIDSVMHFAAKTVVPESVKYPELYFENNFSGSKIIFDSALEAGVKKIIFSSTAAVYAPQSDGLISESGALGPLNPYGESKQKAEDYLQSICSGSVCGVALRYFNVAGACLRNELGQRTKNATHLIKVAAQLASGQRNSIDIYGNDYSTPDGTAVRDYIHVEDLASAHFLVLNAMMGQKIPAGYAIYNCGYGRGASVLEVIKTVEEISNKKLNYQFAERRPGDAAHVVANSQKIKADLGWKPLYESLPVICRSALDWENKLKKTDANS